MVGGVSMVNFRPVLALTGWVMSDLVLTGRFISDHVLTGRVMSNLALTGRKPTITLVMTQETWPWLKDISERKIFRSFHIGGQKYGFPLRKSRFDLQMTHLWPQGHGHYQFAPPNLITTVFNTFSRMRNYGNDSMRWLILILYMTITMIFLKGISERKIFRSFHLRHVKQWSTTNR